MNMQSLIGNRPNYTEPLANNKGPGTINSFQSPFSNKPNFTGNSINSAMSNVSTAVHSSSPNPFSKSSSISNSVTNAFVRPGQSIPLLGPNQTSQNQIFGVQKPSPNAMNSNVVFGSSNSSMMQNQSNSNALNFKKPSSNIFSNTTTGTMQSGNSPNIYSHNPSAANSPFGLTQSKTQFTMSGNPLSFKPIKTENVKLDSKHLVSCIAMEKRYFQQKLSKQEIRIAHYRSNQTGFNNFNGISNAYNNFNQPKTAGVSFNPPINNTFQQQNYGVGVNQSSGGNIFGQSHTGNNFQIQNNNVAFHPQNSFGSFNTNNPFQGNHMSANNNSFAGYQNNDGQGNNVFSNFTNIMRNASSMPPFSPLGIKPGDPGTSQKLLAYIQNGGNLNSIADLFRPKPPQHQNYMNLDSIQLLQGLQVFLNELYGTNLSLSEIAQGMFQGNLSQILDMYSQYLRQSVGIQLSDTSIFTPLAPSLFSPPENTKFDEWMSQLDDYMLSNDEAYKMYLDSPCARLFGDDESVKSIMSTNRPLRKKIINSVHPAKKINDSSLEETHQRQTNRFFFCQGAQGINQQRLTHLFAGFSKHNLREREQTKFTKVKDTLEQNPFDTMADKARMLGNQCGKTLVEDDYQNQDRSIRIRPVRIRVEAEK